jgi:hypothetical protein
MTALAPLISPTIPTASSSGFVHRPTTIKLRPLMRVVMRQLRAAKLARLQLAANQAIALSWPAVPGARAYHIYRGTSSGGENLFFTSTTNSFTDYNTAASVSATPQSSSVAYGDILDDSSNAQITLGSAGTASSQLYLGTNVLPPVTVTNVGTSGATWDKYIVVGLTVSGSYLAPETGGYTDTANATLSGTTITL